MTDGETAAERTDGDDGRECAPGAVGGTTSDEAMTEAAADRAQPEPDWAELRAQARAMTDRAYAPYSQVRVGAAALVSDGRIVTGCNVENASYGLSLCAECSVASALAGSGGGRLVALAVVGGDGEYLAPCGRCRQVLYEFGGPDLRVDTGAGVVTLADLLPGAFGPADLTVRASAPRSASSEVPPSEVDRSQVPPPQAAPSSAGP